MAENLSIQSPRSGSDDSYQLRTTVTLHRDRGDAPIINLLENSENQAHTARELMRMGIMFDKQQLERNHKPSGEGD